MQDYLHFLVSFSLIRGSLVVIYWFQFQNKQESFSFWRSLDNPAYSYSLSYLNLREFSKNPLIPHWNFVIIMFCSNLPSRTQIWTCRNVGSIHERVSSSCNGKRKKQNYLENLLLLNSNIINYSKIKKIVAVKTEWLSMNFNRMSLPFGKNGNF